MPVYKMHNVYMNTTVKILLVIGVSFQIRVVNAFRSSLYEAGPYRSRMNSVSSTHNFHSVDLCYDIVDEDASHQRHLLAGPAEPFFYKLNAQNNLV